MAASAALAGPRGPRDQHAAAAIVPLAAEHGVESIARPLETRSLLASWSSPIEVIGRTTMPPSSIRNGYSLVPWLEPRYLTTRSRRVET